MTPVALLITLGLALVVLSQSRRMAAVGIIAAVCYLSEAEVIQVGFHFTSMRIVLLAGLIRVIARGELSQLRLNKIDRALIALASCISIISTLRTGTVEQLVYQIGCLYDVFLSYFVFRSLLRDERDYREILAKVAFVIIPFALLLLFESFTGRNPFFNAGFGNNYVYAYGGGELSWIRDGHVRCQGPFRNPITAGAFGATFAMLFAGLLFAGIRTRPVVIGVAVSTVIVMCAHSSGPFLGCALGVLALAFWPLHRHTDKITWGIIATLAGLQLIMNPPVWFLIARISELTGGGGYHRAFLIDQFVNRFSSWWLVGTSNTQDWFPYQLPDGKADLTNIFVANGVNGGLLGVILTFALIARCFKRVGVAMKSYRGYEPKTEKLLWGIGATLVGSIGILCSVTYMDQMQVIWYFLLASMASVEMRKSASGRGTLRRDPRRTRVLEPSIPDAPKSVLVEP